MGTIAALQRAVNRLDLKSEIKYIINEDVQMLADYNREQLYSGRFSDGELITPNYLTDPFFKGNRFRSYQYAKWKQEITPNSQRPFWTPNLFINGFYHSSIDAKVDENEIHFFSMAGSLNNEITSKYDSNDLFGLTPMHKAIYTREFFWPKFKKEIELITGLKFKR
ncbi:hypothetical protein D3C80_1153500 [compost metagenome]